MTKFFFSGGFAAVNMILLMMFAKGKARYIIDKGFPIIDNFYSDSLADTPLALCAEKAHLVIDNAQRVVDWPELDKKTMAKVKKKIDAANEAGVDVIYKCGGAQAIAALAFGTQSIAKVDKIVGPGNIFVALAKKSVFGYVSIDSIAGPSEILVLADETANPTYVAADLLSQAEHDELASAILVTTSAKLADEVESEIERFVKILSRKDIIQKSLDNFGYLLIADNKKDAIDCVNAIASEHLEIVTANPFEDMTYVKNAGAIFLGQYSSEPLGDYFAGPNHVLPTNGTARFFSALSVDDFIKKSSIISYSKEALEKVYPDIVKFANNEQLTAHANSIKVRFEDIK